MKLINQSIYLPVLIGSFGIVVLSVIGCINAGDAEYQIDGAFERRIRRRNRLEFGVEFDAARKRNRSRGGGAEGGGASAAEAGSGASGGVKIRG